MTTTDTREQILDAVSSVIVREGVRGASLRRVAEEADVSLGLLSYHFDDKQTLILVAFERASSRLLEASVAAARREDDADERVRAFLRCSMTDEFLDEEYLRLRISLWAVALTDPAFAAVDAAFYETYAGHLGDLIATARPTLDAATVAARANDMITMSNGLWLNHARWPDAAELERGLRQCEAIGLAPG